MFLSEIATSAYLYIHIRKILMIQTRDF